VYIENLLTNQLLKKFWKSVHICKSYYQTSSGFFFWDSVYNRRWQTSIATYCREMPYIQAYITVFFFIIYIWRYSLNKFNHDFVKLQCNMCKCSTWLSSRLSQTSWTSSCKSLRPCSHSVMSISTTDQYNYEDFCCALSVNYLCDCVE